ncbi:sigma-70 family RNA polymerase sigma factor [Bacillaceae bacterium SIJ1]|uniref:sigma-70 family RNA polymerase sigma factor n=1 Tax=Litoribacterium kuwaitense TaxID=1398745 RepID=UPI0013ED9B5E|nr:sigma-70 family RNA polymerase sigma factor [Litoribacterium kuwaitense]NGP45692.1 sigma-70 family RNA polymerase sigma factor [Litoribacterium kuwaitense]
MGDVYTAKESMEKVSEKMKNKKQEERFLSLIHEHHHRLYRIAFSYVKNKEDALDIIQESVYKGYKSYHKVKQPEYEKTWITKIVMNSAIDFIKKNKRVVPLEETVLENVASPTRDIVEDKLTVEEALDQLSEKQRAVVILRFFEDMKLAEIAEVLDAPVSTIKSLLYRALKQIEVDMKEADTYE